MEEPPTDGCGANSMIACWPTATLTRRGVEGSSSASRPGCVEARRDWPSKPAPRCIPRTAGTHRTAGSSTSCPRWTPVPVTSRPSQALADVFAERIAAHPQDWHMLQPQWIINLSDERRARLAEPS